MGELEDKDINEEVCYVYHISLDGNLDDGYIGITKNMRKRFESHKNTKAKTKVNMMIAEHNLTFEDMKIIRKTTYGEAKIIERELRPEMNIGWNVAKGGGGANNVGKDAYNYRPDLHVNCKDCNKQLHGCATTIRCMDCHLAFQKKTAKKHQAPHCPDCGIRKEGTNQATGRCKACFSKYKSENPSEAKEPYYIVSLADGSVEKVRNVRAWCKSKNMSHKAPSRFNEIRRTIRNGIFTKTQRHGSMQRRWHYEGYTVDESPYEMRNHRAKKKIFKMGDFGLFASLKDCEYATGYSISDIANKTTREKDEWFAFEVDLIDFSRGELDLQEVIDLNKFGTNSYSVYGIKEFGGKDYLYASYASNVESRINKIKGDINTVGCNLYERHDELEIDILFEGKEDECKKYLKSIDFDQMEWNDGFRDSRLIRECMDCGANLNHPKSYPTRCKPCAIKAPVEQGSTYSGEPFILINKDTGGKEEAKNISRWCREKGLKKNTHIAFHRIRSTMRNGFFNDGMGSKRSTFSYKNWTLDETLYCKNPYRLIEKSYTCGEHGKFSMISEAAESIGMSEWAVNKAIKDPERKDWFKTERSVTNG